MHLRTLAIAGSLTLLASAPPRAAPAGGTVTGSVVVARDGKVVTNAEWVYVYLKPLRGPRVEYGKNAKFTIQQKGQRFDPHVQVVPLGASVAFPNNDTQDHNVFSPTEPGFDLKRFAPGKSPATVFHETGEYEVYCDIHKDMWAKVKVVDTPWFAPVVNGAFTIPNVPAGRYKAVAWAPDSRDVPSEAIVVVDGGTVTVPTDQLHLQLKKPNPLHTRKDGSAYPPY